MKDKNRVLKNAYKQAPQKAGVYALRNTANGKLFIGSGINLDAAWNRMRTELNFGGHRNALLQSDWNQFGSDAFAFEILAELKQNEEGTKDLANESRELEALYLSELQPFTPGGYNIRRLVR